MSLLRPVNGAMAGAAVLVGAVAAVALAESDGASGVVAGPVQWWPAILCALSAFAASGASNALNDAIDVESDRLNRPLRPVPSGAVSPRAAGVLAVALYAAGALLAVPAGLAAVVLVLSWVVLTALYSLVLEGVPLVGNMVVAAVAASPLVLGGLSQRKTPGGLLLLFGLAALLHLARELYKDAEDAEGDRRSGVATLAVRAPVAALGLGRWLLVLSMAAAFVPYAAGLMGTLYLALLAPIEGLLAWLVVVSFRDAARGRAERGPAGVPDRLKIVMALGLVAFLVGPLLR